jgi:hypothetical protein
MTGYRPASSVAKNIAMPPPRSSRPRMAMRRRAKGGEVAERQVLSTKRLFIRPIVPSAPPIKVARMFRRLQGITRPQVGAHVSL